MAHTVATSGLNAGKHSVLIDIVWSRRYRRCLSFVLNLRDKAGFKMVRIPRWVVIWTVCFALSGGMPHRLASSRWFSAIFGRVVTSLIVTATFCSNIRAKLSSSRRIRPASPLSCDTSQSLCRYRPLDVDLSTGMICPLKSSNDASCSRSEGSLGSQSGAGAVSSNKGKSDCSYSS